MRKYFLGAFLFICYFVSNAQTFSYTGPVVNLPGTGTSPNCYNLPVSGVGIIGVSKGLSQVCLNINHPSIDELEILLQAPDGTYVPLTIQNGAAGADNYTNTCFSATATSPIKFNTAPFTGSFLPEGHLGAVNNGQNADGTWKLCILDRRNSGNAGTLLNWSLTFSNNPAPPPPAFPNCTTTIPSSSNCANAASICDFNGACGSTINTPKQSWTALDNASCFGLNNNTFVKFVAASSTVSFSVWVNTSNNGFNNANGGIQMLFFSTPSCGGAVTTYGCYNRIYPYATAGKELINLIYANGLTPGNTYYLMIDGANGDQCDFRIAANSGVNILSINPPNPAVCNGQSISLSATGGNGTTYNWSSTSPNITFSPATGATVSATPSGTTTTIPVTVSSTTPAGCPNSTTVNLIVNPNPATPTINTTPATCSAPGSSTISNYNASFTYAFSPTGPSVGTGGSIIGMNIGTNYTVTAGSGNCTSAPSSSFSNGAQLSSLTTPTISSNPATCSVAGSSTISNYNAGLTYTFNPTGPSVGTGGAISGMTVGTSYTVTASNGSCTSVASGSFSNAAQQNTPAIPTINTSVATCSAASSSTISNYSNTLTYTFNPTGPTVGTGGLISGMTPGTNYTVTAGNGNCTSGASATFSNAAQLPSITVPTISSSAPSCSAAGSSTISNYNNTLTYTFNPSGPTVGAGGAISGMSIGTNYTVIAGNGVCSSLPSSTFSNAAQLSLPATPQLNITVKPTCNNQKGTIEITSPVSTAFSYGIDGAYQTSPAFPSLLTARAYTFTVRNTSTGCTSLSSSVTIDPAECGDDLFVPNAFSPNGDGKNDLLYVRGSAISKMQFLIYNQWGEIMFESNNLSQGWDGRFKGKDQPVGVYVYVLRVTSTSGTTINKKGSITLIR